MCIEKYAKQYQEQVYFVFRLLVGLLFAPHGAMKVLGMFGGTAAPAFSLMWFVGMFELIGGIAVVFGLYTRLAAVGGALLMLIAYFKAHAAQGLMPIVNRGELAVLYFAAFLVLAVWGAGKWSLEKALLGKERF